LVINKIMHHSQSIADVRRLRIASLLLLANHLLVITAAALLLVSFFANDHQMMILGSILVPVSILLIFAQWIAASHVGCPLCRTPILAPIECVKHRKARRLLGSYKLRVALAVMFKDRFRCPYCNERTAIEVKERLSGSRPRNSGSAELSRFR
jgi:hypothetical protein